MEKTNKISYGNRESDKNSCFLCNNCNYLRETITKEKDARKHEKKNRKDYMKY
jgi:hypothetical protein